MNPATLDSRLPHVSCNRYGETRRVCQLAPIALPRESGARWVTASMPKAPSREAALPFSRDRRLALRESVYREIGAVIEQERLWTNMLSASPCANLFGWMKAGRGEGESVLPPPVPRLRCGSAGNLLRAFAGRGNPAFTDDNSAFDVFVVCVTPDGESGFIMQR